LKDLIQALTGAKIDSLDPREQKQAARDAIDAILQALRRTGEVRERRLPFAAGKKGEKSPRALELLKKRRELEEALSGK
jgi:hypothetical protein